MTIFGIYHYLGRKRAGRPKKQSSPMTSNDTLHHRFAPLKIFSQGPSFRRSKQCAPPTPLMLLRQCEMIGAAHYGVAMTFLGLHRHMQMLLKAPAHKRSSSIARLGTATLGYSRIASMTDEALEMKEKEDFDLWKRCHAALSQHIKMITVINRIIIDEDIHLAQSMVANPKSRDLAWLRKGLDVLMKMQAGS